ncbi:MAG: hypothetical protein ACLQF0_03395 [Dissulfurispiraceae bacterium]
MNQKLKRYLGIAGVLLGGVIVLFIIQKLMGGNPSAARAAIDAVIGIPLVVYIIYLEDKKRGIKRI